MNWINHSAEIRNHLLSDEYHMTSITCSQDIGYLYFTALKCRMMMPKLSEIRSFIDVKCWLVGHLIKSIHGG